TFVLFASRADQLPDHYRRYLINSLRESFDLPGVPMRLTVKSNKNPFAEGEAKSGPTGGFAARAAAKAVGGPTTGMRAKSKAAASAKAKAGAEAKPKRSYVAKPKLVGNPKGRTQKLARPGVKPKRASRTSASSPKTKR
ncbi:MAG: ribosome biogenesis GTPase Der, partial [Phenylobacterium sp.]|nr:ribosome biogenesis GTPase Der [Phenylobacterium sp.]